MPMEYELITLDTRYPATVFGVVEKPPAEELGQTKYLCT
jgi:hypothetical protein